MTGRYSAEGPEAEFETRLARPSVAQSARHHIGAGDRAEGVRGAVVCDRAFD